MTKGQVITTIFGVLIGAMSLGQMAPGATALGQAKQAGYRVFETLERVPPIDAASTEGSKPDKVEGRLEFREVCIRAAGTLVTGVAFLFTLFVVVFISFVLSDAVS